jgi:hypothetical protein
VHRVDRDLDVDARIRGQHDPKAVERHDAAQLREQRRQAAVASFRPERIDELVPCKRPVSIHHEEREQDTALAARQPALGSLSAELEDEPPAELHLRMRQGGANIAPTGGS